MADICLIYAREDRRLVAALERILTNAGWSVWWDERIDEGHFDRNIERELAGAQCVIPVWSTHSVTKDWVRDEARYAREHNVPLIPVRLDLTTLPVGHGQ